VRIARNYKPPLAAVRPTRQQGGRLHPVHARPELTAGQRALGRVDLRDIVGLNRALNERISDQADLIRYHADPLVIFKGIAGHIDLTVGPGTIWDIPTAADVKLLECPGTAPAVGDHLDRLLRPHYEVSETPRAAFDSNRLLSGVALEIEPRPLIQKKRRGHTA